MCIALQRANIRVWFDEDHLVCGNIYSGMARGIDASDVVLVCLTKAYMDKVNDGLKSLRTIDNCACEWSYALARRKPVVALVMEPDMLDTRLWPSGPVSMHLASNIYVDASGDDWNDIASRVCSVLRSISPRPANSMRPPPVLCAQRRPPALPSLCACSSSDDPTPRQRRHLLTGCNPRKRQTTRRRPTVSSSS